MVNSVSIGKIILLKIIFHTILECIEKVPWIYGKPRNIVNLDDNQQVSTNKISLTEGLRKGDYYITFDNKKCFVAERKDKPFRFEHTISQIRNTVEQLINCSKRIDGCIIIAEKIHKTESKMIGVNKKTKKLIQINSTSRKEIRIRNLEVLFYTVSDVNRMRSVG